MVISRKSTLLTLSVRSKESVSLVNGNSLSVPLRTNKRIRGEQVQPLNLPQTALLPVFEFNYPSLSPLQQTLPTNTNLWETASTLVVFLPLTCKLPYRHLKPSRYATSEIFIYCYDGVKPRVSGTTVVCPSPQIMHE